MALRLEKRKNKSKIGKAKKLKVMLQKRLKQYVRLSLPLTCKSLDLGGQGYDGEVDSTEQWPMERMNIYSNWL